MEDLHQLVANFYSLKTEKILTGRVALGDWLGCYRVSILRNTEVRELAGLHLEVFESINFLVNTIVQGSANYNPATKWFKH